MMSPCKLLVIADSVSANHNQAKQRPFWFLIAIKSKPTRCDSWVEEYCWHLFVKFWLVDLYFHWYKKNISKCWSIRKCFSIRTREAIQTLFLCLNIYYTIKKDLADRCTLWWPYHFEAFSERQAWIPWRSTDYRESLPPDMRFRRSSGPSCF